MFGTNTPLSFYVKQCKDIYGISIQRTKREIRWANTEYGEYKLAKTGATRIIFPNGSVDPWHALSYLKSEENIIAIYIKGKVKNSIPFRNNVGKLEHEMAFMVHLWLIWKLLNLISSTVKIFQASKFLSFSRNQPLRRLSKLKYLFTQIDATDII